MAEICEWKPEKHEGKPCPTHQGGDLASFSSTGTKDYLVIHDNHMHRDVKDDNELDSMIEYAYEEANDEYVEFFTLNENALGKIYKHEKKSYASGNNIFICDNALSQERNLTWEGQTYFHELTHVIDRTLASKFFDKRLKDSNLVENYLGFTWKSDYISSGYISEASGMTLQDTVKSELKKIKEDTVKSLTEETEKIIKKYCEEEGISVEVRDKLSSFRDGIWEKVNQSEEIKEIVKAWNDDEISTDEFWNKREEIFQKEIDSNPELKSQYLALKADADKHKGIVKKARHDFLREYAVVSDVISSKYYKSEKYGTKNRGLGLGHSEHYYAKRAAYGLGIEFLANTTSALVCNQTKTIETTQKYFPKSVEVVKEIMKKVTEYGKSKR